MEASKTYCGADEVGLGWTFEDIFGPSPGDTPVAMESFEDATEFMRQGHEEAETTAMKGATEGDEGMADGKTVDAEQDAYRNNNEEEDVDAVVPEVGMKFDSTEVVYEFYKKYGRRIGFPVRKRTSTKDRKGDVVSIVIECSQEKPFEGASGKGENEVKG
ncbi:unnamed protein product [Cuscuta epithymum]|uniref:FAR1 domain-containing protein n=1 Tax=Cuscuta epithymum TaxID=186058 RepID=A0AAV0FE06_9ASTE|nr:unnamed protein product [Cuscuta epithymum]